MKTTTNIDLFDESIWNELETIKAPAPAKPAVQAVQYVRYSIGSDVYAMCVIAVHDAKGNVLELAHVEDDGTVRPVNPERRNFIKKDQKGRYVEAYLAESGNFKISSKCGFYTIVDEMPKSYRDPSF